MTLALTLGMTVGIRRTLWMMVGELSGIALVASLSIVGVAALLLVHPRLYQLAVSIGGVYLIWIGVRLALCGGVPAEIDHSMELLTRRSLALRGFVSAVANPKAWAFYGALLPPFIAPSQSVVPQLAALLALMLAIEFAALLLYAGGGRALKALLQHAAAMRLVHVLAGGMILVFGIRLLLPI